MKKFLNVLFTALFGLMVSTTAFSAETEIKLSVLAPEGSTWVKVLEQMNAELKQKSGDKLAFKIYAGGVSGDEKDVLRKMRIGQVQAAAFTGVGLGEIVPQVRILELPMLFNNYKEVDYVKAKISPELEQAFANKGFILLGWAEAGFVNIYSNKPIKSKADMNGIKFWAWEGDPLVKNMYTVYDIVPIPLALPDVLTSLQTHLIDGVYGPPLAVIALQWFTKVKYMTDINLANSTGAMLISKAAYNKLPPDQQALLKAVVQKYSKILVDQIRLENTQSIAALKKNGIQIIAVDPKDKAELTALAAQVYPMLVGVLYPAPLLEKVQTYLAELRKGS